jgi:hypothetical protein
VANGGRLDIARTLIRSRAPPSDIRATHFSKRMKIGSRPRRLVWPDLKLAVIDYDSLHAFAFPGRRVLHGRVDPRRTSLCKLIQRTGDIGSRVRPSLSGSLRNSSQPALTCFLPRQASDESPCALLRPSRGRAICGNDQCSGEQYLGPSSGPINWAGARLVCQPPARAAGKTMVIFIRYLSRRYVDINGPKNRLWASSCGVRQGVRSQSRACPLPHNSKLEPSEKGCIGP